MMLWVCLRIIWCHASVSPVFAVTSYHIICLCHAHEAAPVMMMRVCLCCICPSHAHEAAPVMMLWVCQSLCVQIHAHEAAPVMMMWVCQPLCTQFMPMRLPQS
jgi:hypothetical protein